MFPDVWLVINISLFTLDCVCVTGPPVLLVLGLWAVWVVSVTVLTDIIGGRGNSSVAIRLVRCGETTLGGKQNLSYCLYSSVSEVPGSPITPKMDAIKIFGSRVSKNYYFQISRWVAVHFNVNNLNLCRASPFLPYWRICSWKMQFLLHQCNRLYA